jgi:radical SAM family uncharacterized protein
MQKRTLEIIADRLETQLLPFVRQPARYIGGEINQIKRELAGCELRFALCFPDIYEIAMSHTGLAILYEILNQLEGVAAERVFAPWIDAEERMRQTGLPLFSLESKASLKSFDVVGFCLTNELCYTNVLNMLDLGGLAVRSVDRGEDDPLIVGGGGMANCCEPVADFIDAFILGDGEEAVVALCEHVREARRSGVGKAEMLLQAAQRFEWFYVPSLYQVTYQGDNIQGLNCTFDPRKTRRSNAVVQDFENCPVPTHTIVPSVEAIHERVSIEIMRGCPGRCRFCQVSYCKRPIRIRSVDRIVDLAEAGCNATGFDTVSLLSLSSAEYPYLEELLTRLAERLAGRHVGISVPSLRVDRQLQLLPKLLSSVRKAGLTMAVEAASERLREVIRKPISDEDLTHAVEAAYRAGWQRLKLYFMVGLPGETEGDIRNIVRLSHDLALRSKEISGRMAQINVAVSWFVPKAHTPFGWVGQCSTAYFEQAKDLILQEKRTRRARCLKFKFHDTRRSVVESALGRGDRRLGAAIEAAWRDGARFDLWDECFEYERWLRAFSVAGQDLEGRAQRSCSIDSISPWDHLGGADKSYLAGHFHDAQERLS